MSRQRVSSFDGQLAAHSLALEAMGPPSRDCIQHPNVLVQTCRLLHSRGVLDLAWGRSGAGSEVIRGLHQQTAASGPTGVVVSF